MKKTHIIFISMLVLSLNISAQPKATHYSELNNKSGINLWKAINTCTQQGYHDLSYDGLITAYKQTDVDDNGNLIDMYGGCSFDFSNKCGNYNDECDCYNREHSLPKSWWGSSPKTSKQGSDIFHVVPTDGYVNNRRSSYAFGEVSKATYAYNGNQLGTSAISGYSGTVFEPQDEYKGDFARGYFGTIAKWELNATSGAGGAIFTGNYTESGNFGLTQYGITLLMKWHRQDPVSEKELKRNNAIEATQGNRNPFIDYPELAEYLWGNKKGQTVKLSELTLAYDSVITTPIDTTHTPADTTNIPVDTTKVPVDTTTVVPAAGDYMLVVAEPEDWTGTYLIVNTQNSYCLNAALASDASKIKSAGNKMQVTIENNTIAATTQTNDAVVTIVQNTSGCYIKSKDNYYLGITVNDNTLNSSQDPILMSIKYNNGETVIAGTGSFSTRTLRYNNSAGMFRCYTTGQQAVQLFKKTEQQSTTPTQTDDLLPFVLRLNGNTLLFESEQAQEIAVYTIYGNCLLQCRTTSETIRLQQGLYVVSVNGKPHKMLVP